MEPLDAQLFKLVAAAIGTGLEYVRRRREENAYIKPHQDWPELKWRDNGMPLLSDGMEGPPNYANALTERLWLLELAGNRRRFDQEPSVVSLLDYVRTHPQISKHFGAAESEFFQYHVRVLLGDVLDRYIHTSGQFEVVQQHLLKIYSEVERYLLRETLVIAIIVPILCLRFEAERVDIDKHTAIVKLNDRMHLARTPDWKYQHGNDPRVASAATHAFTVFNYSVPNENQLQMWHVLGNAESYPLKLIDDFYAALRLAIAHPTGYAQLLVLPIGWAWHYKADLEPLDKVAVRSYPPCFENGYWDQSMPVVTTTEMQTAADLFLKIRHLEEKKLSIALRRLNSSSLRTNSEDGLLDAMIGLESLLSDGNQEMTYKIAMRVAGLYKLLDSPPSVDAYRELKAVYTLRSKVVHGGNFDIDETVDRGSNKVRIVDAAVEHLRAALRVLIEHNEYLDVRRIDRQLLLGRANNPSEPE